LHNYSDYIKGFVHAVTAGAENRGILLFALAKMEQIKACIVGAKSQRRGGASGTRDSAAGCTACDRRCPWSMLCASVSSGCCWKNRVGERGEKRVTNAPPRGVCDTKNYLHCCMENESGAASRGGLNWKATRAAA